MAERTRQHLGRVRDSEESQWVPGIVCVNTQYCICRAIVLECTVTDPEIVPLVNHCEEL